MTLVNGRVTVTDSQGNETVAPFQFVVDGSVGEEPPGEEPPGAQRQVSGFQPDGFTVPAGEAWEIKGLVETPKNVVVEGILVMRPGATLRFVNVNESAFVGGGMDPIVSDVGLWIMGDGVLDAQGTPKTAWNRTGSDPSWSSGDERVLAPWASGDYGSGGFTPYSGGPVPRAHPAVPPTEVLNLSRDVVIEGTPAGRSHVFVRSTKPQIIRHVLVRHMGPRRSGKKVTGRWPMHFHQMHEGSFGMVVEGVVVRNAGSHAFVTHLSHGVTLRDCIAYDVQEDPYWWDLNTMSSKSGMPPDHFTDHTTYERCVAALVKPGDDPNGHRLCGFNLAEGTVELGNRCIGSVAVGVQGGANSSGFGWQEKQQGPTWVMEDCVSHNNRTHGLFVWWNVGPDRSHHARRLVAYRNGDAGIAHGAYVGEWLYEDDVLVENAEAGVLQHAHSTSDTARIRYVRPTVIGSPVAFKEGDVNPNFASNPPALVCAARVEDCDVVVDDSRDPATTFEFRDSC